MVPNNKYMMRLGDFEFSVASAAFNKLNYQTSYQWEVQKAPTDNKTPVMQYNGPGERNLTIEGTIYPQMVKDGLQQVDKMREQALKGEALPMCYVETAPGSNAGVGRILGKWCILNISENRTLFLADGNPREIQFSMTLKAVEAK